MPEGLFDSFGEAVTDNGDGSYTRGGVTVEAPSSAAALTVFGGMAPEGWTPPPPTTTDPLTFLQRFTLAEQAALMAANPVWGVMLAAAGTVDVTDPLLLSSMSAAVSAGAITSARSAQVLDLSAPSP